MQHEQVALDWEGIKAEIYRRGYTLAKIANDNGMCASTIRNTKKIHHKRAEAAIAAFLGLKPQELWPERYNKKPHYISTAYRDFLKTKKLNKANKL